MQKQFISSFHLRRFIQQPTQGAERDPALRVQARECERSSFQGDGEEQLKYVCRSQAPPLRLFAH